MNLLGGCKYKIYNMTTGVNTKFTIWQLTKDRIATLCLSHKMSMILLHTLDERGWGATVGTSKLNENNCVLSVINEIKLKTIFRFERFNTVSLIAQIYSRRSSAPLILSLFAAIPESILFWRCFTDVSQILTKQFFFFFISCLSSTASFN